MPKSRFLNFSKLSCVSWQDLVKTSAREKKINRAWFVRLGNKVGTFANQETGVYCTVYKRVKTRSSSSYKKGNTTVGPLFSSFMHAIHVSKELTD